MADGIADKFFENEILHFVVLIFLMMLVLFIAYKAGVAITIMSYLDLSNHAETNKTE